ncbi:MAG: MBL fold metallo-hydrolase [Desulfobacterales bacterium]
MIIETPGFVTNRILLLGRKESCVYLLNGKSEYVLVGGGLAYIVPDVIKQLRDFNIEEKKIKRIIILHSHFDHCGIVPFFKKRYPWLTITASERAKELLAKPKVAESISLLNQMMTTEHTTGEKKKDIEIKFTTINVDDTVKEKDVLTCGDLPLEVIEVPGHSSCSIALYVPREKAMFASDAGGVAFGHKIFTAASSNFDKYQESLKKMAGYEIEVFLSEHFGARTGSDGRLFLQKSIEAAAEFRTILKASLAKTEDVEKSTQEVTDSVMVWMPAGFMPRDIISMIVGQMLRFIADLK